MTRRQMLREVHAVAKLDGGRLKDFRGLSLREVLEETENSYGEYFVLWGCYSKKDEQALNMVV